MYCNECGFEPLKKTIDIGDTRLFICPECFTEHSKFIGNKVCDHEYDEKSKDVCIHCAKLK